MISSMAMQGILGITVTTMLVTGSGAKNTEMVEWNGKTEASTLEVGRMVEEPVREE